MRARIAYHQVDILHHTPIIKLHAGAEKPADVGLHLNRSREDAVGKFIVDRGMLAKQPGKNVLIYFSILRLVNTASGYSSEESTNPQHQKGNSIMLWVGLTLTFASKIVKY